MDGRANAILAIDQRNFTSIWISRAQRKTFLALIPAVYYSTSPRDSTSPFLLPSIITPFFAKKLQTYESRGTLFRFFILQSFSGLFSNAAVSSLLFFYIGARNKRRPVLFYFIPPWRRSTSHGYETPTQLFPPPKNRRDECGVREKGFVITGEFVIIFISRLYIRTIRLQWMIPRSEVSLFRERIKFFRRLGDNFIIYHYAISFDNFSCSIQEKYMCLRNVNSNDFIERNLFLSKKML